MTILVTGAAGFIGFHVARRLLGRGEKVIGVDNVVPYYSVELKRARLALLAQEPKFHFLEVDFSHQAALDEALRPHRFDRIVHLGAQAGVRHSLSHPHVYVSTNVMGHLNLLETARHRGVDHMVYASSSSVYGGNARLPSSVDHSVDRPVSLYAATKRADELMSETYSHLYRVPQTGLRFFTAYGPWGRPDMAMWLFADAIRTGQPIEVYNYGRMRRDFTYIDDVVTGILACLDRPPPDDGEEKPGGSRAPHRLYNIGNDRSEDLMHMIGLIEAALGQTTEKIMLPLQPGDVPESHADVTALRRDTGFAPSVTIEEGIPRFIAWYRCYHGI